MKQNMYLPEGMRLGTLENREAVSSLSSLERAMNQGTILEGMAVLCDHSLNLRVEVGSFIGWIPRDETVYNPDGQPVKDIAIISRVGKAICFRVMGVMRDAEAGTPQLLLSRRAAQQDCCRNYLDALEPGDLIPAKVTHLENFGAFVDVGCGVVSLLSVDCLSVSRIHHPRERLLPGQSIRVAVRTVFREQGRIFVTLRELLGTWEENAALFESGQTVVGTIRSVESYGVFVELTPNLTGLTELKDEWRASAEELIGRRASVFIKSIVPEKMKIKLVLIDIAPGENVPAPLTYYIPEDKDHLDSWKYSPDGCRKTVETVFTQQDLR